MQNLHLVLVLGIQAAFCTKLTPQVHEASPLQHKDWKMQLHLGAMDHKELAWQWGDHPPRGKSLISLWCWIEYFGCSAAVANVEIKIHCCAMQEFRSLFTR